MKTIAVEIRNSVARVTLRRPDVRNALDEVMIAELARAFGELSPSVRAVVLSGEGPAFCAGADAAWMKKSRSYTEEENVRDASALAAMLRAVDECPCPVLARVHGAALGGGSGLVAACDLAVAAEGAVFGFTEVRLGLVPAVISTFVLPKIGLSAARRFFLTGERFGARQAREIGLVHEVADPAALDARVDALVAEILQAAPEAVAAAKRLLREAPALPRDRAIEHTVRLIARVRAGAEAQEGLAAFLEKRKPRWV
jgi:methylglutaconyl-CoA hydratase